MLISRLSKSKIKDSELLLTHSRNSIGNISANREGVEKLIHIISYFGLHLSLTTEKGLKFENSDVLNFYKLFDILIHFVTPLHPNSNAIMERFNFTVIEHLGVIQQTDKYNFFLKKCFMR